MTQQEATANIGQPFKIIGFTGMIGRFDTIRRVDPDGTIHGDFLEAHCDDCRFKEEQPAHLKKTQDDDENWCNNPLHTEIDGDAPDCPRCMRCGRKVKL